MSLKLIKKLVSHSFQETMIYRQTAIITLIFGLLFFGIELIAGFVYFQYTDNVLGWTYHDYLLLISTATIVTYLYQTIFVVAHENLADTIVEGELDYTILRPVNSFLFYVLYRIDITSLINLLISIIIHIYILSKYSINIWSIILHVFSILLATYFVFILNQLAVSISFWKERSSKIVAVPEYLVDFASRPAPIYPGGIRFILTWVLPILTAINSPVLIIRDDYNYNFLIWTITVNILGSFLMNYVWKKGLKQYASAN